jgi:hypothetical protein
MRKPARLLAAAALAAGSVWVAPVAAHAGSPDHVTVTPSQAASYSVSDAPNWADPAGMPAPACTPSDGSLGCDRETVTLGAGGLDPNAYDFALQVTVSYQPADALGQDCPDVGIEDATATTVFSSQQCAGNGGHVTAAGLKPDTNYTVEVDANGSDAPAAVQPFSISVAAFATPKTAAGSGTSSALTFTHEVTVDANRTNGEPDLAIADNGTDMYTSGPWGFTTSVSMAWKSDDAGVQWDLLHGSCPTNPLRPFCSRGGGDTEVQLGTTPTQSGKQPVYFVDLNGLDTLTCAYSDNGGDTFTVTGGDTTPNDPLGAQGHVCNVAPNDMISPPGSDRQWIAVWPAADNLSSHDDYFMIYDTGETPPTGDDAMMSLDGGKSLTIGCRSVQAGNPPSTTSCVGGPAAFSSRPGPLVINPNAINTVATAKGNRWPTLYEFMGTNSHGPGNKLAGPEVNISCDGGQSWSHVDIAPSHPAGLAITNDFVVGAIDSAGGLYTAWAEQTSDKSGQWQTFYSHSVDTAGTSGIGNCSGPVQGGAWSAPVAVTGAGSAAPDVNFAVMPWITAGDPGRVDIGYYGDSTDPASVNPASAASMKWYLHLTQTTNGLDANPTFSDAVASETPMHAHSICFSGIGCSTQVPAGDRNLADFFEVRPDPTGRAVILFVDDNNTQPGPPGNNPGAGIISSVQQATGPSLYTKYGDVPPLTSALSQSTDVRTELTDKVGDALLPAHQPAPGSNVDAADLTDVKVTTSGDDVQFRFTVKDLSAGPAAAIVNNAATAAANELHTGAIWLATWHRSDDLWFASATTDESGHLSCLAGKPLDVFSSSAPKALLYEQDPQGQANHVVTGCKVDGNSIEVDVPRSDIGNPADGDVLYGLTGLTADTGKAASTAGITGGSAPEGANGAAVFFDNVDEAAPMDVPVGTASAQLPEAPAVPLLAAAAVAVTVVAARLRRRRLG